MSINNNVLYKRELHLNTVLSSCFLFGPRMTGKTCLLKQLKVSAYYDLLDPQMERAFLAQPETFWEEIKALKNKSKVIIDEIQKAPVLLDYVQMGIDRKQMQFFLSGSSARKLKRGKANLLGGRAVDLKLYPLTMGELGESFSIMNALNFGSLPLIASLLAQNKKSTAQRQLKSYVTTYIKEEIQAEALVRNLSSFYRFLDVAAESNAQMIKFSNISRECAVHQSTVKEYYSILEDTLMGNFLWPFDRSERKKARPKFYFFDCGVVKALKKQLVYPASSVEAGSLFETWFYNELIKIRSYKERDWDISLWRKGKWEIDFVIHFGKTPVLAVECKSGVQVKNQHSIKAFQSDFPKTPVVICSLQDQRTRKIGSNIWVEPYNKVIKRVCSLKKTAHK